MRKYTPTSETKEVYKLEVLLEDLMGRPRNADRDKRIANLHHQCNKLWKGLASNAKGT